MIPGENPRTNFRNSISCNKMKQTEGMPARRLQLSINLTAKMRQKASKRSKKAADKGEK